MSSYVELWCFRSGNMVATFASEREAWDWLQQVAMEFGLEELHDLGLSYTHEGESVLIAMDDDLVQRVAHELSLETVASESRRQDRTNSSANEPRR
jgi:hypothetical protein